MLILIKHTDGQYAAAGPDGLRTWVADADRAFRYLPHSGLLAWDLRDLGRKGERVSTVEVAS